MAREQWTLGGEAAGPSEPPPAAPAPIPSVTEEARPVMASAAAVSEADALRDDPESGQLLAAHMAEAGYQPVILFGNAASGKTSLILSLLAAIRTQAALDAGLFLGEPIMDTSRTYGAYLAEQASQFFGLKTQQFIEGTAAARTNIDLPFFIPLIFRPSGKPEARLALMESNGEWYRADRQASKFFPPLRQQVEDFLRHYPRGILFIHLLPYTQRHLYTQDTGTGGERAELEEASLAVSGALQAYETVRVDKSNDRHLMLVTKWDAHRPADLDPVDALRDDPADVAAFINERYSQAWGSFKGLNLRPDQMARNGYCAGQISANNVIRAGPNDDRGEAIRRYPVGLWRWLYRNTLTLAETAPVDPFPHSAPQPVRLVRPAAASDVLTVAALEAFLEAHSYSGGLRHTAYLEGEARPVWAPPADSVGWRDEFAIERDDVVVEFHQREGAAGPASWHAVYRPSIDAQFGDRRNHAGMGLWLHGERVADPRAVLSALAQLSRVLAKEPRPDALSNQVAEFAKEPYLPRYLIPADRLPQDWRGAPASSTTLVDTSYRFVSAPTFEAALGGLIEEVARCSLDWTGQRVTARTLILVSPRAMPPADRAFAVAGEPGAFLADLLERLPYAFDEERRILTEAEGSLASSRTQWETERREQQDAWDKERRDWQLLDRQPPTMEGLAVRLNTISAQLKTLDEVTRMTPAALPPTPRNLAPAPRAPRTYEPVGSETGSMDHWAWFAGGAFTVAVLALIGVLIARFING